MNATHDPVPELIAALTSRQMEARLDAVRSIGRLGPLARDAMPLLIPLIDDVHPQMREAATQALGQMGSAAVSALSAALSHSDKYVRRNAVWALGRLGSCARSAIPDLCVSLGDPDARTCTGAVQALGNMGPDAELAIPALLTCMAGQNRVLCRMAGKALSQIGTAALSPLMQSLRHSDPFVRGEAALALGWMGPLAQSAVNELAGMLKAEGGVQEPWRRASEAEGTAVSTIVPRTEGDDTHRVYAAQALGRIGSEAKPALGLLRDALVDRNEQLRLAAQQAIRQIQLKP